MYDVDDDAFLTRFETCAIPLSEWNHRAHLRISYTYLRRDGLPGAIERMRAGIPRFNESKGIEDALERGYHDTLTVAWLRILHTTMAVHGAEADATAFLDKHTHLHSKVLLRLFYSRDRILTWEAKRRFVEPDLAPLPEPPA